MYQNRVKNKLDLNMDGSPEILYQHLKDVLNAAAKEAMGIENKKGIYTEKLSEELENLIYLI